MGGEPRMVPLAAQRIASGNLTDTINLSDKKRKGIFGAIQEMSTELKKIVSTIQNSAEQITNASVEMNHTSVQVSNAATEQAGATEEVSTSMEQMTTNISQSMANSQKTADEAQNSNLILRETSDSVKTTLESMNQVVNKIMIIDEVSRQTNLLALNAAVEAARAGEHGKGFAVVAAEIRKLAERSQYAAKEIDEESGKSMRVGALAEANLKKMISGFGSSLVLINEITTASKEQNNGAELINKTINSLNRISQANAANAEEMSASAEELNGQAETLPETVRYFKTR